VTSITFNCRCCNAQAQSEATFSISSGDKTFIFSRCSICASLSVINSNENYGYSEYMNSAGIQHYIEVGAGIGFMVELLDPLVKLGLNGKDKSYLELGCGFGFLTDYASYSGFGKSVGVEDASYGSIGSEILGFECMGLADFEGKSDNYDVVLASEVIEHVNDPLDFLHNMKKRLNPGGVIVITTPNALFINQKNIDALDSMTLAALSPGLHTCLFSPNALKNLFRTIGFSNIEIFEKNERLVVYASTNSNYAFTTNETSSINNQCLAYLSHLSNNKNLTVQVGANLRIFKELVNQGVLDERIMKSYKYLIEDSNNPPLTYGIVKNQDNSQIKNLEEYSEKFKFYEGVFTFYASQYERNLGNPGMQLALLEKSISIIDRELSLFPAYFQESSSIRSVAFERLEESLSFMSRRYFSLDQKSSNFLQRVYKRVFG